MKFIKIEVILTDDEGFLVLKGLLPKDSIEWARSVDGKIAVKLKGDIDLNYIEKNINSMHRTLRL